LATINGNTITVQPTVDTEYYIQFENQCTAYDTIRVSMKPQATLTVDQTKECGKTTLTANTTITKPVYTWIIDEVEQNNTNYQIEIPKNPSAKAQVKTYVRSEEYCQSEALTTQVTIDTLAVSISAPESVCKNQQVALSATITTSASQAPQYQWLQRTAGSNLAFAEITGATSDQYTNPSQTENTQYRVTVTAGECTSSQETTVTILTPERTGTITANNITVSTINGVKTHKTCGLTPITLTATHTNTSEVSFTWTAIPVDNTMSAATGKQITVQPAVNTTYIVQYENQCLLTDTILVEVHPLTAYADWSQFAQAECEGKTLTATLALSGYDANMPDSYIKWYKYAAGNRDELIQYKGQTSLTIASSTVNDTGIYSYEVSNGICSSTQVNTGDDIQTLVVKPIIHFTLPQTQYTVIRGENASLEVTGIQPSDATITWSNGTTSLTANPAIITNITQDQTWKVEATGTNYCPAQAEAIIQVDAKVSIDIATNNDKICQGTAITLSADTTGTGKLLTPANYILTWWAEQNGSYTQIQQNSTTLTVTPNVTTRYKAEVIYGSLQKTSSTEITVEVYAPATYTLTQSPVTCSGEEISIGLENLQPANATLTWDDDNSITSSDLTTLQITVRPEQGTSKDYYFTIDQQGRCSQRGTLAVSIQHPITYTLSNDTTICQGQKAELTVRAPQGTMYQWTDRNNGEGLGTSSKLQIAPEESTTYAVTMTSPGVCPPVTGTITVEVSEAPEITQIELLRIREVEIHTNPNAGRLPFLYQIDNETYVEENILTAARYGKHTYTVLDANGCKTTQEFMIDAPKINPPVVFTPDGDGLNDIWEIPGLADAYPDAVITIYDRFGKRLVEVKASEGGWDGTYLGKPMPSTDYWYEIVVEEIVKIYIGHFTLLRK